MKSCMNDFGEEFSDEEDCEVESDNDIPNEEMSRMLIYEQFFDCYFDEAVFNLDSMIRTLRKYAGETHSET